jgi:NADPH:quinone reductase-like Zn-dependent oxidoreductase
MKSYHATAGGGLASLVLREHAIPEPGPRELLVRVHANSLNARELSVLRGTYPLPVKQDVVMCSDGAGVVVAIGTGATHAKVGDRVAACMFPRWRDGRIELESAPQLGGSLDGMLSEYVVLHEDSVVQVPAHLTLEEAATLPCAAVTAWNALTGARPLQAGDDVLILGSGGLSIFALQLAKAFGARVIVATSSEARAQRLQALGADEVINYRANPTWAGRVRELTAGRGVDQVIDVAGATLEQSMRATALDGLVNFVGRASKEARTVGIDALFSSATTVRVVFAGHRRHFLDMNRALVANAIRPVIDRTFSFEESAEAFRYFESGQAFGKVVIRHAAL